MSIDMDGGRGAAADLITETNYRSEEGWEPLFDGSADDGLRENYIELDLPPGYRANVHEVEAVVYCAFEDAAVNSSEYQQMLTQIGTDPIQLDVTDFRNTAGNYEIVDREEQGVLDADVGQTLGIFDEGAEGTAHAGHPYKGRLQWSANESQSGPIPIDPADDLGLTIIGAQRAQSGNGTDTFLNAVMTVGYQLERF